VEEFNPLDFGTSPAKAICRFGEFDSLVPEAHFIKREKKKRKLVMDTMDSRQFRALKS